MDVANKDGLQKTLELGSHLDADPEPEPLESAGSP